jgi:uncharacterized protein DUF4058
MPLLDHFHPPLQLQHPWESFHSNWATRLADGLNERWLPPEFLATEHTHAVPSLEIDVATFERRSELAGARPNGRSAAAVAPQVWTPPEASRTMPAVFPDTFEVRVFSTVSGLTLVGAIELISPANKDRPEERRAFATKCASYLYQGISLVIIDIVTNRRANLHNETMRVMAMAGEYELPAELDLYAVAYRPVRRQDRPEIDFWPVTCAVGAPLPDLPLRLTGDLIVPVEFEAAYQEACRRRRLA